VHAGLAVGAYAGAFGRACVILARGGSDGDRGRRLCHDGPGIGLRCRRAGVRDARTAHVLHGGLGCGGAVCQEPRGAGAGAGADVPWPAAARARDAREPAPAGARVPGDRCAPPGGVCHGAPSRLGRERVRGAV
ncbi:MAG: Probable metallo-hydrolase YflN, partial [uncultured Rubellimicrobium sp.]